MTLPRPAVPSSTFRVRLALAFALVVAIALGLVLAAVPRLVDGYFAQQEHNNLVTRTVILKTFVRAQLTEQLGLTTDKPRPIFMPTTPTAISDSVVRALGRSGTGFVRTLTDAVAQANVEVTIADAKSAASPVYRLEVPLGDDAIREATANGERRDALSYKESFEIADPYWTQYGLAEAPRRVVTIELSDPFTFREKTLETLFGVLIAAAGLALIVAVFASLILASRLTIPIRRLTAAARELAEGNLDARVSAPPSGSPEISELATTFNLMAERLQQSIGFIRRDRDRSREFLADASHELRTPLAALRTFNELLSDGAAADPATRVEFLESSRQQIERLDWLASNLLELSKLDSGLVALDLRPEDLRAVIENAVHQAEPAAREKDIELVTDVPDEPIRQRHDPQRMGQVMANLLGNSIKFTPRGGRITASIKRTPTGAELRVADTGRGIDPRELPHVFERFYRGTSANGDGSSGAGLGLSIVRSIVDMHGGRVEIASRPGTGTEVVVSLPTDVSVSSPAAARG